MAELECFPMAHGGYPDQANTIGGWLVTSWPGGRIDPITGRPGTHGGIDLVRAGATLGEPFYAVVAGRVSQGWDGSGGGNWTSLFGDNGDYFGYGHAQAFAPGVHGTHVAAGTLLGWIDSTGGSTGSHMHFAVNFGGSGPYDDPTDTLRRAAARGAFPGAQAPAEPNTPTEPTAPDPSEEDDDMAPPLIQLASTKPGTVWGAHIGIPDSAVYAVEGLTVRWCSQADLDEYHREHAAGLIRLEDIGTQPDEFFDARTLDGRKRPDGALTS